MIKLARITFFSFFIVCLLSFLAMPEQSFTVSSVTVEKGDSSLGASGFQFTFTGPGNNTQFRLDQGESQVFSDLTPGTYTVTEINIPADFVLRTIGPNSQCGNSTIDIDVPNATATIELGDNCDLGVVFVNDANSSVTIVKETIPVSEDEFNFTTSLPGPENFTLTNGERISFGNIPAGTYTVEELITNGFTLTNIVCDDPDSSTDIAARTATIVIEANDNVTCTFTNIANGTIIIQKGTVPIEGMGFTFTENIPGGTGTFELDDGQSQTFNDVTPGEYKVTEDDPIMKPEGFFLSDIFCDDMGSSTNLETRTATIDLDPEETITCRFANTTLLQGLNIIKTDSPDPVVAGQELTYEITIINESNFEATNVLLVDMLPDGVIPVDV